MQIRFQRGIRARVRWFRLPLALPVLVAACDGPRPIAIRNDAHPEALEVVVAGASLGMRSGQEITFESRTYWKEGDSRWCLLPPCRGERSRSIVLRLASACGDVSILVDFPQDSPAPYWRPQPPLRDDGEPLRGTFGYFTLESGEGAGPRPDDRYPSLEHKAVVLWVDNRDGPERTLAIGPFSYAIAANETGPRLVAPALCEAARMLTLDGEAIGELPLFSEIGIGYPRDPETHWLLDTSGARCYEREEIAYGSAPAGYGPVPMTPAHLHEVYGPIDHFFEEAPDTVTIIGPVAAATSRQVLDVPCDESESVPEP